MSSILVVERDPRYLEPIREALASGGWRVRLVSNVDQAIQSAASEAPELVLLSLEVPGADAIANAFSRSAGGPGVVGLLPERMGDSPVMAVEADELLQKPFGPLDLVTAVRRVQAQRRLGTLTPSGPQDLQRLTSKEIFGDVLAEVEDRAPNGQASPSAPKPGSDEALQRKLEKTVSGVLGLDPRPKPTSPSAPMRRSDPSDADIEALLSKTLSNLDLGRTKTGVRPPAPAAAAPSAPAPAAPPRPPVAPPPTSALPTMAPAPPLAPTAPTAPIVPVIPPGLPANSTVRMEIPDFARSPAPPPARVPLPEPPPLFAAPAPAPPPPAAAPPAPVVASAPAPRKPESSSRLGDLDLTDIENLARTGRSSSAPRPAPLPVSTPPPATEPAPAFLSSVPELPTPPPIQPTGASVIPQPSAAGPATTQRIPVWSAGEAGDQPGSTFGQYTLLEKIAVGGMAEVWKARSRGVEGFQKTVAIKKILPHMTDNADFVGMFIDEAKLAAQLNHPNIVHIYDLGKIGRDYYIAMEYVDGKDLRSLLNAAQDRGLRMAPGLAALIAARLASALDYAHRKRDFDAKEMGLVHRDVSPQNVLLTHEGDVKLCDFGIAKAVSKASQTQAGALKGKLQYMSPEQAWGKPVDGRSDLFSLGSVLFEMLTGQRLFAGDSEISILDSVRQGKIRTPRQVDPSLPAELDGIVAQALEIDPERRCQSAGEMLHRLEGFLAHLSPGVGPTDLTAFLERAFAPLPAAPPPPVEPEVELPAILEPEPTLSSWGSPAASAPPPSAAEPNVAAVTPLTNVSPLLDGEGKKGRLALWGGIAAVLVLGVLAYLYFNVWGGAKVQAPASPPGAVETSGAPAPPATSEAAAALPPGATTSAPQAGVNIEGMVNQALAKREQELRQQQEENLKRLQQQLSASKGGPASASATPPPASDAPPANARPVETAPPPAPVQQAEPPPVRRPDPEPEPAPRQAEPVAPPPEAPRAKLGELVTGGPGVAPPQLVSAPNPEYPAIARNLRVEGVVVVSVLVDENGRVEDAKIAEPIRQNVGINESALRAARGAHYRPATKDGVRVKMWTRIRVPFKL